MSSRHQLVTAKVLATRYAVEKSMVYKWVRCGALPAIRISRRCIRFNLAECDQLLAQEPRSGISAGGQFHGA